MLSCWLLLFTLRVVWTGRVAQLLLLGATTMLVAEGLSIAASQSSSFAILPAVQGAIMVGLVLWFVVFLLWEVVDTCRWARQQSRALSKWVARRSRGASMARDLSHRGVGGGVSMTPLDASTSTSTNPLVAVPLKT